MAFSLSPVARIWNLVREEKTDIKSIYFYAIFSGLIQLSLPVGIQSIIGFVLAGTLSPSLVLLITLIVTGVLLVGLLQIAQMKIIERIQQSIFVRNAFAFANHIPRIDLKKADAFYLPELVNRFFDTVSLQKSFSKLLLDLPTATIQILFGLILLSFYHPTFILFGIILVFLLWLILYLTSNKGLESSIAESTYKYAVVGWLEEMARVVKSFKFSTGSQLLIKKADEKTIAYLGERTRHFSILLTQYRTLVAFKVAITAAMLIVGIILLLNQQINIGQFVAAEIIIITVINAIEKIIINLDSVYDVLLTNAQNRFVLVKKAYQLGDRPAIDTIEAVTQVQTFEVQKADAYTRLIKAQLELSTFLWKENNEPYELPQESIPEEGNIADAVLLDSLLISPSLHPDLQQYRFKLSALQVDKQLKFQSLLPDVRLKYNQLGKGYDFIKTAKTPYFENNYRFGVSVAVPLRLSSGRGEFQKAKLKIEQTTLDQLNKQVQIQTKIKQYYTEWQQTFTQITIQDNAVNNYVLLQRGEEIRFMNGESSLFLINSREQKTLEARQKRIELQAKNYKAYAAVKWASGLLVIN